MQLLPLSQLSKNTRLALGAFIAFDVLVASWLIYLLLVRGEINGINELRDLGATRYPQPARIENMNLIDANGDPFTEESLRGRWSLVFFGFTSCPDVCPLTMEELAGFYRQYEQQQPQDLPNVLFITVDPERDGIGEVADYMARYDERFIGLTGEPNAIAEVARQFYVAYAEGSSQDMNSHGEHGTSRASASDSPAMQNEEPMVSHNAHLSLVNPQGELDSVIRPPIRRTTMLELYPRLIAN